MVPALVFTASRVEARADFLVGGFAAGEGPRGGLPPEGVEVNVIELRVGYGILVSLPNALRAEDASGSLRPSITSAP